MACRSKKFIYLFISSSYLTLHLAPVASRVFKASSASSYVSMRKREGVVFSSCVVAHTHAQRLGEDFG
jgi:hypothetical protein